ncbi:MAG: hypothetical protein JHD07_08835 [Bradyrhizobium sp.]|uniref:hypothetical protein n=1 Tax=Bradyrhizobium sp. TaxID=376 RepID=UPI001A34E993|nr:hypothetical protein [Bradyrhizobium sp.]MBJ7403383.1 hypothetical protein [Bradyrhizobium sp.]
MKPDLALIGLGLYTPSEAATLTGIPGKKIRRWLRGHTIRDTEYPALWTSNLTSMLDDVESLYLSFLDVVQLRVADAFIRAGLSAQKVRRAIEYGSEIVRSDYPFANARFRTDGKTVILHVMSDEPEAGDSAAANERLIDLFKHGQYLMQKVIEPSLKGLEFDDDDMAARWWPLGRSKGIVIDPRRQFGTPIDDATGVPTSVLAEAAQAEGSIAQAAKMFMVPQSSVSRAVAFEQQMAA